MAFFFSVNHQTYSFVRQFKRNVKNVSKKGFQNLERFWLDCFWRTFIQPSKVESSYTHKRRLTLIYLTCGAIFLKADIFAFLRYGNWFIIREWVLLFIQTWWVFPSFTLPYHLPFEGWMKDRHKKFSQVLFNNHGSDIMKI